MSPNPFAALIHSRKFWLAVFDALMAMAVYFVAKYAPTAAEDVKFAFLTLQPVIVTLILAIAWEDTKAGA